MGGNVSNSNLSNDNSSNRALWHAVAGNAQAQAVLRDAALDAAHVAAMRRDDERLLRAVRSGTVQARDDAPADVVPVTGLVFNFLRRQENVRMAGVGVCCATTHASVRRSTQLRFRIGLNDDDQRVELTQF